MANPAGLCTYWNRDGLRSQVPLLAKVIYCQLVDHRENHAKRHCTRFIHANLNNAC